MAYAISVNHGSPTGLDGRVHTILCPSRQKSLHFGTPMFESIRAPIGLWSFDRSVFQRHRVSTNRSRRRVLLLLRMTSGIQARSTDGSDVSRSWRSRLVSSVEAGGAPHEDNVAYLKFCDAPCYLIVTSYCVEQGPEYIE